eukprot:15370440-Alexandrium_andersonii.AAC.1
MRGEAVDSSRAGVAAVAGGSASSGGQSSALPWGEAADTREPLPPVAGPETRREKELRLAGSGEYGEL